MKRKIGVQLIEYYWKQSGAEFACAIGRSLTGVSQGVVDESIVLPLGGVGVCLRDACPDLRRCIRTGEHHPY